jgi:hypothetical protein
VPEQAIIWPEQLPLRVVLRGIRGLCDWNCDVDGSRSLAAAAANAICASAGVFAAIVGTQFLSERGSVESASLW